MSPYPHPYPSPGGGGVQSAPIPRQGLIRLWFLFPPGEGAERRFFFCAQRRMTVRECSYRSPLPLPFDPLSPSQHALHPRLVVEVPVDGAGDAGFEIDRRFPAELALQLRRIDCVAAVVARAILHEFDQR